MSKRPPLPRCKKCCSDKDVVWADSGVFESKPYIYCRKCKIELDSFGWEVKVKESNLGGLGFRLSTETTNKDEDLESLFGTDFDFEELLLFYEEKTPLPYILFPFGVNDPN